MSISAILPLPTHVKISQLLASLQTSRQQVVFARLVTSCQQVWNKLLTTCNNLVDIIRLVTRLFQQGCYNHGGGQGAKIPGAQTTLYPRSFFGEGKTLVGAGHVT